MTAEQIRKWREDAIADGWMHKPIYSTQPEDTATQLEREGWIAQVYLQLPNKNFTPRPGLHIWGPDSLVVNVPEVYDWKVLQERLMWCSRCGNVGNITVRLGFAGRVCPPCREKYKAEVEYPGWTN